MRKIVAILALALFVSSCAEQPHVASEYGFWCGLWHGMLAPWSFIASLFSDTIRIYNFPNNGCWYDFGFMLGIGAYAAKR